MDLNEMNPVLLVATLTQQVVELEKKLEADGEDAEIKAALSEHLLKRGNLLMQMGDKDGARKDMQRYLQLNPEKIGEQIGRAHV